MTMLASQITSLTHGCLLNRLFRRKSKKTSKLRVTGLCAGNSPGTGEFPAQMASYAENVSIWWRHHEHIKKWLFHNHYSDVTWVPWRLNHRHLDNLFIKENIKAPHFFLSVITLTGFFKTKIDDKSDTPNTQHKRDRQHFNTLRPRQNCCYFADILKLISWMKMKMYEFCLRFRWSLFLSFEL